ISSRSMISPWIWYFCCWPRKELAPTTSRHCRGLLVSFAIRTLSPRFVAPRMLRQSTLSCLRHRLLRPSDQKSSKHVSRKGTGFEKGGCTTAAFILARSRSALRAPCRLGSVQADGRQIILKHAGKGRVTCIGQHDRSTVRRKNGPEPGSWLNIRHARKFSAQFRAIDFLEVGDRAFANHGKLVVRQKVLLSHSHFTASYA